MSFVLASLVPGLLRAPPNRGVLPPLVDVNHGAKSTVLAAVNMTGFLFSDCLCYLARRRIFTRAGSCYV